ncbi:MAG: S41 family peptidase [Pyrinomonadaceae bacterium]
MFILSSRFLVRPRASAAALSGSLLLLLCAHAGAQQTLSGNRDAGRIMLGVLKGDVVKNYYDPTYHGINVETSFKEAEEQIKQANSLPEILGIIANTMMRFDDSHTFFMPPSFAVRIQHGWVMEMIGDKCYVVAVQPGSNAEAQGLRPGDRVLSVESTTPTRRDLWKLQYTMFILAPRPSLHVMIEKPDGRRITYETRAVVHEGKPILQLNTGVSSDRNDLIREWETDARLHAHHYYEFGKEALVWKMPAFDLSELQINEMLDRARERKSLILDLRGNGGGAAETLVKLVGGLFDHDVKVGDLKRRKESKPLVAKTRGANAFTGQLVVLVDSESGSAAEVLARVVQLEKRGTVIGDRSMGAVMLGRSFDHQLGDTLVILFGSSVSDADLLLSDGHSLEHAGVTPDELILPKATDLASQSDPVLARAAQLAGLSLSPEKAGAMFPVEWRK